MIGRPRKACLQCSSQKLRCVGQRPLCDRCKRLGRACRWSVEACEVPRSKKRTSLSQQPTGSSSSSSLCPSGERPVPRSEPLRSPPISVEAAPSALDGTGDVNYTGIPLSVVLRLVDVYFLCLYSAPLIFHKATLLDGIKAGTVKPHVILSTCALASSFSTSSQSRNDLRDDGFSKEWAERAGRLALLESEEPSQDTVISFINLGLFWYSQGHWRRSLIYEGYASLNARLLRLLPAEATDEFSLDAELRRRQFWASFLVNQFVSEPAFPKIFGSNVGDILLPVSEEDYKRGVVPAHDSTLRTGERSRSVFAELIRILSLWTDVYEATKDANHANPSGLSAIQILDSDLRTWYSELPSVFKLASDGTSTCNADIRPQVLLLHVTYHQCLCALHCSIVPLFSLSRASSESGHYVHSQRLSAQIAFENASEISSIIKASLTQEPSDAYRWPGFTGFALYCSCAIQLPYLWCSDAELSRTIRGNIRDNLSAMAVIGQNWRYVAGLGVNVKTLYQYHSSNSIPLRGPPSSLSANELAGIREGEPRALLSPIGGNNSSLWNHRSLMEQGKLANVGPEGGELESSADQPCLPEGADVVSGVPLSPDAPSYADTQAIDNDNASGQDSVPTAPYFVPPILSSLFPGDAINYDLGIEDDYAEFLSTMVQNDDTGAFSQEQAIAAWFDS